MNGAGAGGGEQCPAMVFVQDSRRGGGAQIPYRIVPETGNIVHFLFKRTHLAQQRIGDITFLHSGQIASCDPQRKLPSRLTRLWQQALGQIQQGQQFRRIPHGIGKGVFPIGSSRYHIQFVST